MKRFVFPMLVVLLLLWSQAVLADSLSLAKQWESRGNYQKAAEEYSMAAAASDNLNSKAELMYEVGRCRIKAGEVAYIGALISDIRTYASDKGAKFVPKLLTQLEELAWKLDDEAARQALSVIVSDNPNRRKSLSEKANAKNRKALTYWLNPALNEADCKAKRAKALEAKTVTEIANRLATARDTCVSQPSENEYKAFADRAITELDTMSALPLYEQMKAIWGHLDDSNINALVTYGRKIRVIEGNETTVERIRRLLPDAVVEDKLARESQPGEGQWRLLTTRGGERSPRLIAPAVVGNVDFGDNGCVYTIVFEDGQRFNLKKTEDKKRFNAVQTLPKFYVVAAPSTEQPPNLSDGLCKVDITITAYK